MWIAEEGLTAKLPEKWSEHVDAQGNIFYWNADTEQSQWHHPCDEVYKAFALDAKKEKLAGGVGSTLSKPFSA